MHSPLRLEQQRAPAKIEQHCAVDGERRKDDFDALEGVVAEHALVWCEVALDARSKPAGELAIGDERGRILLERSIAEHVVRMHVGVDHVADRLACNATDGVAQLPSTLALPSVSITATESLPTTKPAFAMSPRFSGDCIS
jgi:hypothetical protein